MKADYVFLTISPESLYSSPARIKAKIYLRKRAPYTLSFPKELQILDVGVSSVATHVAYRIIEDAVRRSIQLTARKAGEIFLNILVSGAVQDSGWDLYPLVSGHVGFSMTLDSYKTLRVSLMFPRGCRGYIHHCSISVLDTTYDFSSEAIAAGHGLNHEIFGMRELEISYSLADNRQQLNPVTLRIDSYFRQAFISLAGSFLLPFLVGFPIILVWGFPGLEPIARLTFTLSAVPLVFSMWYRTLLSGIQDILSLMDGVYAFLVIVWAAYAIFYQTVGSSIGLVTLAPYFGLILYSVILLFGFRAHPYKDKTVDPRRKSIPTVFKLFRRIVRSIVIILDMIYYGRTQVTWEV